MDILFRCHHHIVAQKRHRENINISVSGNLDPDLNSNASGGFSIQDHQLATEVVETRLRRWLYILAPLLKKLVDGSMSLLSPCLAMGCSSSPCMLHPLFAQVIIFAGQCFSISYLVDILHTKFQDIVCILGIENFNNPAN